jgi:hypothetical protein
MMSGTTMLWFYVVSFSAVGRRQPLERNEMRWNRMRFHLIPFRSIVGHQIAIAVSFLVMPIMCQGRKVKAATYASL